MAANNAILQTIVEEDKRGRVMSYCTMSFLGIAVAVRGSNQPSYTQLTVGRWQSRWP
jgi:hypothetical protein